MDLGLEIQKTNARIRISILEIPGVPNFSQNGQIWVFGLNLGKLPNHMQYFGSNNVEGVAVSWVEAKMKWMEVDGAGWSWIVLGEGGWRWMEVSVQFSNTQLN